MTNDTAAQAANKPAPRATKLRWQNLTNRLIRCMLRTPGISRLIGAKLITVYVIGRKSGQRYAIPVAYTPQNGDLLIGSPFGWIRNLRTGDPVDIRLKGRRVTADVRMFRDQAGVVAVYGTMARENHAFANFNKIAIGADGEPDPGDLTLAFDAGARAAVLTPR